MEGDMHLYEVVGSRQERQELHANNETERITSFNDRPEYMSLCGLQQEDSSEYQQPQQCGRNTKTAENKEGASEYCVLKDELKQTKVCLRALSLLLMILFLMTSLCLGLAAYCFSSTMKGNDFIKYRLNMINSEVMSHKTFINNLESQLSTTSAEVTSQKTSINNLELQVNNDINNISIEVTSQRTSITTLNSQLNGIGLDVSIVNGSVTNLRSQLTRILSNSSFLVTATSQPIIRLSRVDVTVTRPPSTLRVTFAKLDGVTFNQEQGSTTTISTLSSSAITSGNYVLAYRPNYQDSFRSNLGTIFIHVEAVYPCATSYHQISCKLFPNEDDGFRGGRAIFEAMDEGINFQVFNGTTYAFAIEGCSQINYDCYSSTVVLTFTLVCLVPSSVCS